MTRQDPMSIGSIPAICLAAVALLVGSCWSVEPWDVRRIEPAGTKKRLEEDLALVAELRWALAAQPFTVEALQRELGSSRYSCEGGELGAGARWVVLTLQGGHTTARVAIFAASPGTEGGSAIARIEVEQGFKPDCDPRSMDRVESELRRAWDPDATAWKLDLRFERVDRELEAALLSPAGGVLAVEPPEELAEAFRSLMDPDGELTVGIGCGYAGLPPNGNPQTAALVAARRLDLLRAVLHGPNPEARVYAAHALTEHGALEPADVATIETLRRLPMKLMTCQGCEPGRSEWDAAFHVLDTR